MFNLTQFQNYDAFREFIASRTNPIDLDHSYRCALAQWSFECGAASTVIRFDVASTVDGVSVVLNDWQKKFNTRDVITSMPCVKTPAEILDILDELFPNGA